MKGPGRVAKSETHPTSLNHQLLLKIRRLSFNNTSSVASGSIAKIVPRGRASLLLRIGPLKRAALILSIAIQSDLRLRDLRRQDHVHLLLIPIREKQLRGVTGHSQGSTPTSHRLLLIRHIFGLSLLNEAKKVFALMICNLFVV